MDTDEVTALQGVHVDRTKTVGVPLRRPVHAFTVVATLAVVAWAFRLALVSLSGASLHVDEAQYWWWSRDLQWGYFSKPPMIAALIGLSTHWWGDGLLGVKALAMACYPLSAMALYGLGSDMAGRATGLWAAGIFLASPIAGLLGLAATTDAPLMLCWALALWAAWRVVMRDSVAAAAALALALGAGLLSKYTMAALVPGLLFFAWRHGRRAARWHIVLAVVAGWSLFLPHLIWNAQWGWPTLAHTINSTDASTGASMNPPVRMALLALAQCAFIGPAALWLAWRRKSAPRLNGEATRDLLIAGTVALLLAGAAQSLRGRIEVNWLAPTHLSFALALALFAPAVRDSRSAVRQWSVLLSLQALLVAALALLPAAWTAWRPGSWPPANADLWLRMRGWQPALAQLEPAASMHRSALLVASSRQAYAQALYEWRNLELRPAGFNPDGKVAHHFEMRCPWSSAARQPGSFLLLTEGPPAPALRSAFAHIEAIGHTSAAYGTGRVLDLELYLATGPLPSTPSGTSRGDCL